MHLPICTLLFLIFMYINKIYTQGIPVSPCPKIFQYRFDGSEWFGILSVRNTEFSQTLHLRVVLSMRGKPMTNYLGEIELLTRGQFSSETPILYKIKFPKNHFPPKLLQISTNNQVICLGTADHSIFVTQIQLEHTRKLTFLTDEMPPHLPSLSSVTSSLSDASLAGGQSATISTLPITTGLKDTPLLPANIAFGTRHLPLTNMQKNPVGLSKDICGTIDDRIRFQVLHDLKQIAAATVAASATTSSFPSTVLKQHDKITAAILMSTLLSRQNDDDALNITSREVKNQDDNNNEDMPLIVTSDIDTTSDIMLDDAPPEGSINISELPSITRGAWPWLAAIYVNNLTSLTYQCGGTLVSTRVVISAAHCFQLFKHLYTANEVLVFLGRHNLKNWNEDGSLAAPVDDIFIHPEYNKHLNSYDADIAVVILKNEVRFNTYVRPACLWSGPTKIQYIENEHGIVVGWSLGGLDISKLTSTASAVPKIVSIPIVSNDDCFRANPIYRSLSSNRTFCAGIMLQNNKDTESSTKTKLKDNVKHELHQGPCAGDSGAGLMLFKNNRWMLRGTVAGSLPINTTETDDAGLSRSCSINQYVIYADVAEFIDWILAFLI